MIKKNIPLHDKNWFKTGGPARYFAEPKNSQEFIDCLEFAEKNNLDLFILGSGANVLISDDGFDGLVIHPALCDISLKDGDKEHQLVCAGTGVSIEQLIAYCLENNLLGLEEFSGIPSTIGGALYNNLHYFQVFISDFLVNGTIIDKNTKKIKTVDASWFELGYDQSKLHDKQQFLLDATFKLKKATDLEIAYAQGRRQEIIRHRLARYPSAGTCGSFFRNFHPDEVTLQIPGTDKKMIFVAYYLDKIGVKGALGVGEAVVSHKHANMLVNKGGARSADLIKLARTMQEMVYEKFGILPQPECELVGFKDPSIRPLSLKLQRTTQDEREGG